MSRVCELTGRRPATGNLVSHSNTKTRTRWLPNLRRKKFRIDELGQTVTAMVCAEALRTIDKHGGLTNAIMKAKEEKLSAKLLSVRNAVSKARRAK